jgi:hypothetical protein
VPVAESDPAERTEEEAVTQLHETNPGKRKCPAFPSKGNYAPQTVGIRSHRALRWPHEPRRLNSVASLTQEDGVRGGANPGLLTDISMSSQVRLVFVAVKHWKTTSGAGIDCGIDLTVVILKVPNHEDSGPHRQGVTACSRAVAVRSSGVWQPGEPVFMPDGEAVPS